MQQRVGVELKQHLGEFPQIDPPLLEVGQPLLEHLQDRLVLAFEDVGRIETVRFDERVGEVLLVLVQNLDHRQTSQRLHPVVLDLIPTDGLEAVGHRLGAFYQDGLPGAVR